MTELSFVSLYSGAGGLDLGFLRAGWKPIWANEMNPHAAESYENLIGHEAVVARLEDCELPLGATVDAVVGGPPCQGFSRGGRMDPDDDRSIHVFRFADVVARLRPRAFVMENVPQLALHTRWGGVRARLMAELMASGYACKWLVLDAASYGVPQHRERAFLVGAPKEVPQLALETVPKITVRDALTRLPTYGEAGNDHGASARIVFAKSPVVRRSPYAGMLFNGSGRPLRLDSPSPTLPASMGGNRTPIIDEAELRHGADPWIEEYHADLMAGQPPRLGTAPKRLRRLTVQEASVLQGFPVGFDFSGPQSARFAQIGNSVPPPLAESLATALARYLRAGEHLQQEVA